MERVQGFGFRVLRVSDVGLIRLRRLRVHETQSPRGCFIAEPSLLNPEARNPTGLMLVGASQ